MKISNIHRELVERPSNERVDEVRNYISSFLEKSRTDSKGNIIATKGKGKPHIILNSHIDTVSPHFNYKREGDIVKGRGSCDAKGPLSVLLKVFSSIDEDSTSGKITIAITPDEETTTEGAKHLAKEGFNPKPELVIVGEPTNLNACLSARGYYSGNITITGSGGHSSGNTPNPVFEASKIIHFLEMLDEVEGYSFNPTIINGGSSINKIPEEVQINFTKRVIPVKCEKDNLDFSTIESEISKKDNNFDIDVSKVDSEPVLEAFNNSTENKIVEKIINHNDSRGKSLFKASTEASHFVEQGLDVCIFGPGELEDEDGPIAHSSREYISIDEMRKAEKILKTSIEQNLSDS